jgi:D-sedoheptulose 7-phosphate isomerase
MSSLKLAILSSISAKKSLLSKQKEIELAANVIFEKIKNGGKVFLCGNGGSAADAQHLAAEFLIRLKPNVNRRSIPALTLALDSSTLTACSNDYGFVKVFSRALQALGSQKDILIILSTTGNSLNILEVLKFAKKKKIFTIGFLGNKGGKAKKFCNIPIIVNSYNTARIQESHIFLGHYIFEYVEDKLLKSDII